MSEDNPASEPAPPPTAAKPERSLPQPIGHVMQFFHYEHLPAHLREVSEPFCELAAWLVLHCPHNPELTVALRKLLEGKDAAVRAVLAGDMAAVSGSGYHGERFVTVCLYCHLEQGLEASKGLLDAESGECTDAYTALMVSVLEVVQPSVVLQMCDEHSRSRRVQRGRIAGYMGRAKKLGER